MRRILTALIVLVLLASPAGGVSSLVVCSMAAGDGGTRGCCCAPGTCPSDEATGEGLKSRCCQVLPPSGEEAPLAAAAPSTPVHLDPVMPEAGGLALEVARPAIELAPDHVPAPPPGPSPPLYALIHAYLI